MRDAAFDRWQVARAQALEEQIRSADLGGTFTTSTKSFRLFLQSAMLGLGAYLVLQNELTPGAMIAGSILLGRALAPIEQSIGQWPLVQRAVKGWETLAGLLGQVPPENPRTQLPKTSRLAGGSAGLDRAPRRTAGCAEGGDIHGSARTGGWRDRCFGCGEIHAGAGAYRYLARCCGQDPAGWRGTGTIRSGGAGAAYRVSAAAGAAF